MSDTFIALQTAPISAVEAAAFELKARPPAEAQAVFEPLPEAGKAEPGAKACGRPSLTLQRQGEVVSAIRIECRCGQVIELACAY